MFTSRKISFYVHSFKELYLAVCDLRALVCLPVPGQ